MNVYSTFLVFIYGYESDYYERNGSAMEDRSCVIIGYEMMKTTTTLLPTHEQL
jgi:hypothetical protein